MREFDQQLLRLKQALRVTEDREAANVLGMTKAAFSARKSRGVFPRDKLFALAAERPELGVDPHFVLTGESAELQRRLKALKTATEVAAKAPTAQAREEIQSAVFEAVVEQLAPDEAQLLHHYRSSSDSGKRAILATAVTMSGVASDND
ncbi:TPA: helix-turn-helix domain-containing protein [Stenotrophomonas maltophilia]|uniref:helix-turn-helix domain-containing protein n=1 Tax=Stenotrophomonas maltophilia TaxID=40324 RepID=UPI002AA10A48|nr:helix-turn-helix domain-containing protein [Stenotrophomonas maltophilia]